MPTKKENINSRNIKYLEIADHHGGFETYIKSSNKWYHISHDQGTILELDKVSFKYIDKEISWIRDYPKNYRIFEQGDYNKYFNTSIPGGYHNVFYDTKVGNPKFYYGEEDEHEITARQIVRRFNKLKKEIF